VRPDRGTFVCADDGASVIAGPREVRTVSHAPSPAAPSRAAYRALLEELVRLAPSAQTGPPSWADALYGDPLRFPPELDQPALAAAKQHFVLMLSRVASANRDVYREIARSVLQDKFALRSAPPPPPPPPPQYAPAPSQSARPPAPPPRASRPGLGERVRSAFGALRREKPAAPAAAAPAAPHAESVGAREKTRTHVTIESPIESVGGADGSGEHVPVYHGSRAKPPMHHADGGLLGVEPTPGGAEAPAAPPPPAEPEPPEQPETRYLNAKLADREADTPLELATGE